MHLRPTRMSALPSHQLSNIGKIVKYTQPDEIRETNVAVVGILDKGLNQSGVHFSLQYIVKGLVILAAVYLDFRRRKYMP